MLLPPRIARRKIKLLESELQMLQKYKTDASLLFDEYALEYSRDMRFIKSCSTSHKKTENNSPEESSPENIAEDTLTIDLSTPNQRWKKTQDGWKRLDGSDDPGNDNQDEELDVEKPQIPEWAKKLYRKIALIAHPDRSSDVFQKDRLKKIFLETNDALAEGNFEKLLGFALELGVEASDNDLALVPLLAKRVNDIKDEISVMEASPEWLWGEGLGAHNMRANIARLYLMKNGIDMKIDDLVSIIQQLEKDNESERSSH